MDWQILSGRIARVQGKLRKLPLQPEDVANGVGERWGRTPEDVTYSVFVDTTELEAMVLKAADNKSGKSKDGALTVVINRRHQLATTIAHR